MRAAHGHYRHWWAHLKRPPVIAALVTLALIDGHVALHLTKPLIAGHVALHLTKPLIRDLYLIYPGIYLLAACGADRLARSVGAFLTPRVGPATHARLHLSVLALLLASVVVATNADLWGDYHLPVRWFRTQ